MDKALYLRFGRQPAVRGIMDLHNRDGGDEINAAPQLPFTFHLLVLYRHSLHIKHSLFCDVHLIIYLTFPGALAGL